jgi:hypothetical protein
LGRTIVLSAIKAIFNFYFNALTLIFSLIVSIVRKKRVYLQNNYKPKKVFDYEVEKIVINTHIIDIFGKRVLALHS